MAARNVIFDWSGTISDDFGVLYEVTMEIFEEHGIPRVERQEFLSHYTLPYMIQVNRFLNIAKEEWDSKFHKVWERRGFPRPFPGVLETLDYLQARGFGMAVLSSHPERFLHREVASYFPGRDYFAGIFAGAYDKREVIIPMLRKLGFRPAETLFVGDTVHDIEAGRHAGVLTAAVLSGYNSEALLRQAGPDHIISTIADIRAII